MLAKRVMVAAVLLPVGMVIIFLGGWLYNVTITIILCLAAWEYVRLFYKGGVQPAAAIVVAGVAALSIGRAVNGFASAPWLISLIVLIGMSYHLVAYERGRDASGTDFGVTVGGYSTWDGSALILFLYGRLNMENGGC